MAGFYLGVWPCWVIGLVTFIPAGFVAWSGVMLIVGAVGLTICIQNVAATTAARKSLAGWQVDRWRWTARFGTGLELPTATRTFRALPGRESSVR